MLAVQADDGYLRRAVDVVPDAGHVEFAARAVLGAEEPDEVDVVRRVQQLDCAAPVARQARMIGDKTYALTFEHIEVIPGQHVDARDDVGGSAERCEQDKSECGQTIFHGKDTVVQCTRN